MREEIQHGLELFGFGPSLLRATLRQFPKKMWYYRSREDRWSIHDLVIQLAESEANMYVACRQLIAEPGSTVFEFDSRRGERSFIYFNQGVRESLKIISYLRKSTCTLLCALPDHLWDNIVFHPRDGAITFNRWMMIQEHQIPTRIEQMRNTYNSWLKVYPLKKSAMSSPLGSENSPESVEIK